ncbi:hypothetical protein [Pectobacterium odoriferum]|uniref:hypothetical protein n=1 Tax=Pectobacterium odoriferum TaxID=78398 RepID=UPI000CD32DD9|nr:hypothetical protein [Pectobacterium odoriferum]POD90368.1 hypothetical protein BV925_17920 [Pectobacterium odoriferum]
MKTALKVGLIGIVVLSVSACDSLDPTSQKGVFYYSNPTASNLTFKVDGKSYDVLPNHRDTIKLSPGKHILENSKGESFSFMVFDNNNGGIINPNNYTYYTLSEAYAVEGKEKRFNPMTYEVMINGHQLEMAVRSANASVIDANMFKCTYQLGEVFPESITVHDRISSGNIQSKCFDKPELVEYIAEVYGENLAANSIEEKNKDSINMVFSYDVPATNGLNPSIQAPAEKLVELLKNLKETDDTAIHEKLRKQFTQLNIDLVKASTSTRKTSSHSVEQNEKYNDFIHQTGYLFSYGILAK